MSSIEKSLASNKVYAKHYTMGNLPMSPRKHLAVISCMDARITAEELLGLKTGDAHIIRNAGGIVTEDALRSLIISHHLLGTREFMIINHTDCGMLKLKEEIFIKRLEKQSKQAVVAPSHFHAFTNLAGNVRRQIMKVKAHPWIPSSIPVRGFIFDVKTGRLKEVK